MANIGHVQYSKGDVSGELKAVWIHDDYGSGTGLAIGNTSSEFEGANFERANFEGASFEGKYQIKYFDESGSLMAELDLEIINNGNFYKVTWSKVGVVTSIGIGQETSNVLSVGYYDV